MRGMGKDRIGVLEMHGCASHMHGLMRVLGRPRKCANALEDLAKATLAKLLLHCELR